MKKFSFLLLSILPAVSFAGHSWTIRFINNTFQAIPMNQYFNQMKCMDEIGENSFTIPPFGVKEISIRDTNSIDYDCTNSDKKDVWYFTGTYSGITWVHGKKNSSWYTKLTTFENPPYTIGYTCYKNSVEENDCKGGDNGNMNILISMPASISTILKSVDINSIGMAKDVVFSGDASPDAMHYLQFCTDKEQKNCYKTQSFIGLEQGMMEIYTLLTVAQLNKWKTTIKIDNIRGDVTLTDVQLIVGGS